MYYYKPAFGERYKLLQSYYNCVRLRRILWSFFPHFCSQNYSSRTARTFSINITYCIWIGRMTIILLKLDRHVFSFCFRYRTFRDYMWSDLCTQTSNCQERHFATKKLPSYFAGSFLPVAIWRPTGILGYMLAVYSFTVLCGAVSERSIVVHFGCSD